MKVFRQGDVLIKEIESIPETAKKANPKNGKWILAEGEATGHHHAITLMTGILFIDELNRMFLHTEKSCELTHQEHGPITIPAGNFEVIRQREYTPEAIRNVAD